MAKIKCFDISIEKLSKRRRKKHEQTQNRTNTKQNKLTHVVKHEPLILLRTSI